MSALFFPLRTSVELFENRTSPEAVTRAKEGAILFDRLIFEAGLLDVTISDAGAPQMWLPPGHITPQHLANSRKVIPVGAPVQVVIQQQAGPGGSLVGQPHTMMSGSVAAQYIAEFHSGILADLAQFNPDWVEEVTIPHTLSTSSPEGQAIMRLNHRDGFDSSLMPGLNTFQRGYIYKSFNRDAVMAAGLDATFNVTDLFSPMLARGRVAPYTAGAEALDYAVPNVGALPWEAIMEFRDHPACEDARGKLREFEERALATEPGDLVTFSKEVGREVVKGYEAAYRDLLPNLPEQLQEETAKALFGLIPVVGTFEGLIGMGQAVAQSMQNRRTWIAALMRLRSRS